MINQTTPNHAENKPCLLPTLLHLHSKHNYHTLSLQASQMQLTMNIFNLNDLKKWNPKMLFITMTHPHHNYTSPC
jgi:hypothetical protein